MLVDVVLPEAMLAEAMLADGSYVGVDWLSAVRAKLNRSIEFFSALTAYLAHGLLHLPYPSIYKSAMQKVDSRANFALALA